MDTLHNMNKAFEFEIDHRVLVVGGVGGIGSAISQAFLDAGCEVVATGLHVEDLELSELQPHSKLRLATLDVTNDSQIASFISNMGSLQTLINCAGILSRFKEYEVETFQKVIDVNLTGTFRMCMACKPLLAINDGQGAIINIASMNAFVALPWIPAYCASKGGVVMLTKSLALAWANEGIRVNAIAPGYVETNINAAGRQDTVHYQRIRSRIAQGRWAQPDDIAGSVLFLATKAAQYITGTVLSVDGGFLAG
jgi:NAD(P)-dependent dehydrogenase (short-subunit alcohol dehydrogenase family)